MKLNFKKKKEPLPRLVTWSIILLTPVAVLGFVPLLPHLVGILVEYIMFDVADAMRFSEFWGTK